MIEQLDLSRCKHFFTEYIQLEEQFWKERIEEEKISFNSFQRSFETFDTRMQQLLKVETPYYNIFHILNIRHYEEKVHTPFLCHLLNPAESHHQGSLFLDSFFESVLNLPFKYSQLTGFDIVEEKATVDGRIDIFIRFELGSRTVAFVIENKINAGDQKEQLKRYHSHLLNDLKLAPEDCWLVYLTLSGKAPTKESIDTAQANFMRRQGKLIERGYRSHIVPWLDSCYPQIHSPRVQQLLFQYTQTVENL
ncbi:MAG: PD-(D/E)XK nuclease family protein [Imperialibacter sp.]|uniref:PDDEXK-like family protein n=1 Tax=Imperialibacter sp. TaxID=2038411 RepID=UPI0032EFFA5B